MSNSHYERPAFTDLGTVEDLTQVSASFKITVTGADIHFNKSGVSVVNGGNAGFTISDGGGAGPT